MNYFRLIFSTLIMITLSSCAIRSNSVSHESPISSSISEQRANLALNTKGKGFGPQSPRDIDSNHGKNRIVFSISPNYQNMNLCNIHFHKNAEHKGGEFTTYAGDGDLNGKDTGFKYNGVLSDSEIKATQTNVCDGKYGSLESGDTIEVHYVHSSAPVKPGPTLNACLHDSNMNPQLRVETQVFVLVNDNNAEDFINLTQIDEINGKHQAIHIPTNTGKPIQYTGSTTGPDYNQQASRLQVSWSVRPKVSKLNINSVSQWCERNVFNEDHAHGVRNLVINPDLLSEF